MTDPIVTTCAVVTNMSHCNRGISCVVVVRVSTMTAIVPTTETLIVETMITLVVDMNIDIEIESNRGAGLAAGQVTPGGHIAQTSAGILHAAALAVPVIVANGTMNEIDAVGLTEVEIPAAGLIR